MRSTLTFAALALALAVSTNAASHKPTFNHRDLASAQHSNLQARDVGEREEFLDDAGKVIHFFDDGGDPAGEDEEAAAMVRRRGAGSCNAPKKDKKTKKAKKTKKTKSRKTAQKPIANNWADNSTSTGMGEGELLSSDIRITWYASQDLLHPACGTGGWNPTSNAHVGAIAVNWKDGPACGEFIDLCNEDATPRKCITVRRIDSCASCENNHVDLTKAGFKALSPSGGLDEGIVRNLKMYKTKVANPWNLSLFGPFKINVW